MKVVITENNWYDPDGHMNDDWFDNPLDKMPLAKDNPRPEEEIADWFDESDQIEHEKNYASRHESSPEFEKTAEEVVTMHEKMYRMATKNGTHTLGGGSENLNSR